MASQIAHIIYAKKYFESLKSSKIEYSLETENFLESNAKIDKDKFILGCLFPDIRRIDKKIKRKDTHLKFFPLDLNFSGLTSFEAGWKFHLYCDIRREEILNEKQFYGLEDTEKFYGGPAKLLEDELIYDDYNNWEKLTNFLKNPPFIETKIGVTVETFRLWYAILSKYIEKKPDQKSMNIFLSKQPGLADKAKAIMKMVLKIKTNKKAVKLLNEIKEEIV